MMPTNRKVIYMKNFNISENTKKWWKCAGVRAIKTMAQTAVAMIGTTTLISEVDLLAVVSSTILAGVLSLLTSIAGLPECKE